LIELLILKHRIMYCTFFTLSSFLVLQCAAVIDTHTHTACQNTAMLISSVCCMMLKHSEYNSQSIDFALKAEYFLIFKHKRVREGNKRGLKWMMLTRVIRMTKMNAFLAISNHGMRENRISVYYTSIWFKNFANFSFRGTL